MEQRADFVFFTHPAFKARGDVHDEITCGTCGEMNETNAFHVTEFATVPRASDVTYRDICVVVVYIYIYARLV